MIGTLLLMVAEAMKAHGNGGTLLVVSNADSAALATIRRGTFACDAEGLLPVLDFFEDKIPRRDPWEELLNKEGELKDLAHYLVGRGVFTHPDLRTAAGALGQLTAVDGAVVLTEDLRVLSFGATIHVTPDESKDRIKRAAFAAPDVPGEWIEIAEVGGTRRQSAARFVAYNQPESGAMAIVASHDGPLSLAAWVMKDPHETSAVPYLYTDLAKLLD